VLPASLIENDFLQNREALTDLRAVSSTSDSSVTLVRLPDSK
jgi:hypothetical protein